MLRLTWYWLHSFRVRVLLVICLVAGVPLALMGLWITGSTSRASEELLRTRVAAVLEEVASDVSDRWVQERSAVLDIADNPFVRQGVRDGDVDASVLTRALTIRDVRGRTLLASGPNDPPRTPEPYIPLSVPVYASTLGPRVGSLEAPVPIETVFSGRRVSPVGVQILVGVFDTETDTPLVPLPFAWPTDTAGPIEWGGESWFIQTRQVAEPNVRLVGAAPLTAFEQPLRAAARSGVWILLAVAVLGLIVASALTSRMAGTLDRLTDAAETVAGGSLDRQVAEGGGPEFDRLAQAFNRMTASLRATLKELAEQRALGRLGAFAASLAHEVRNPLTAIRVDLQVAEETLSAQSLSVSNSLSGRHWELDQVPAVGDPTDIVQFGTGHHLAAGEGRRRVALQRRVAAYLVVGGLEVGKCPFKITGIPKQHMVETFSPRRADQAFHEWV